MAHEFFDTIVDVGKYLWCEMEIPLCADQASVTHIELTHKLRNMLSIQYIKSKKDLTFVVVYGSHMYYMLCLKGLNGVPLT